MCNVLLNAIIVFRTDRLLSEWFFSGFQVCDRWLEGQINDNKCHNCYKIPYCAAIRGYPAFKRIPSTL